MTADTPSVLAADAPGLDTPERVVLPAQRARRALWTNLAAAASFLLVAMVVAVSFRSDRSLSVLTLASFAVLSFAVLHVKFPVWANWTWPAQLVFVPMLFLLPLPLVPLITAGLALLAVSPQLVRGRTPSEAAAVAVSHIGDCWYTIGPVIVLLAFSDQHFSWTSWPVFLLAFGAQVVCDLGSGLVRTWLATRSRPSELSQIGWLYLMDAALSCVGLEAAACAVMSPGLILLELPLVGVLWLFAHERHARIDSTRELSSAYRGTAMLLGDVIEGDDEYTGLHSRAVVDLSVALADRLGLDPASRQRVEFGALLHDVGKIRVPKEIINKPGKLDESEWSIMRLHTVYGEEMLARVGGTLGGVGTVVRHSHERWDGAGYPDCIAGASIPVESRIISACDAYNAMTTDRPYRPAMPQADAFAEMIRCAGSQFDPGVVEALLTELAPTRSSGHSAPHPNNTRSNAGRSASIAERRRAVARLVSPAGVAQSVRAAES